ncbi:MAG: hypothetical protein SF162_05840, partial [bacterium]|nr:hypothetical protein [bacterium]
MRLAALLLAAALLCLLAVAPGEGQEATPSIDSPTETPTLLMPTETFTPLPPSETHTLTLEPSTATASATPLFMTLTPLPPSDIASTEEAEVTEAAPFDLSHNTLPEAAFGSSATWQTVTLHFDGDPEPLPYVVEYGSPGAGHNGTQGLVAVQTSANHPCNCGVHNATVRVRVYIPPGVTVGGISFYGAYTVGSPDVGIASYVRDKRAGLAESGFVEVSDPGLYPTFTLAPRPASGNLNYTDAEYFIVEVQSNAYSTATSYLDTITLRYQGTLPTPTPTVTPTATVTPTPTVLPPDPL